MQEEEDITTEEDSVDSKRNIALKIDRKMNNRNSSVTIKVLKEIGSNISKISSFIFILISNWISKK